MQNNVTVITGNGKGKTTTAMGIMMLAAVQGKRVYFGQFMKQGDYSEIKKLKSDFPEIIIEQYSGGFVINKNAGDDDKAQAQNGLIKARAAINSGEYDLVVLDEINVVLFLEMVKTEQVLELIEDASKRDKDLKLVLTGRYATEALIKKANKAFEVKQIKHYFNDGVAARRGIEM